MTFSLNLHTCNLGGTSRIGENPFTGEPVEFHIDKGLTEAERESVRKLLLDMQASCPDPDRYRKIHCKDGGIVSICIGTLEDPDPCVAFAVEFECVTADIGIFVFNVTRLGNMSVGSTIKPDVVLLTKPPQNELVAKRWPKAAVAKTPKHLESWIKKRIKDGSIV
jgi:hypothetical protein